jgi:hypothetical protein
MSNPSGAATVYVGPGVQAREVWSFLSGHGLGALLLDQHTATSYGLDWVRVVVPATELDSAMELLRLRESASGTT